MHPISLKQFFASAAVFCAAHRWRPTLRGVFSSAVADDPNLIALEGQIRALKDQLAPR